MKKILFGLILSFGLMFWVGSAHAAMTVTTSSSDNGTAITWTAVSGAANYQVTLDGKVLTKIPDVSFTCLKSDCGDGNHTVSVAAFDASGKQIDTGGATFTVGSSSDGGLVNIGDINLPKSRFSDLSRLILEIANWLFGIMAGLATIAIVYSGIMYITAGGDTAKAESARKNLTWAIIGISVAVLASVIISIVKTALGG